MSMRHGASWRHVFIRKLARQLAHREDIPKITPAKALTAFESAAKNRASDV
jgi:hypothetical protein